MLRVIVHVCVDLTARIPSSLVTEKVRQEVGVRGTEKVGVRGTEREGKECALTEALLKPHNCL